MLGAQVGDALDVALGRQVDAAGADHRLAEERRDPVGADAPDLLLQRGQRVERDARDVCGTSGPQLVDVGLDPAERGAEAVRAVVALGAADQVHALGLAAVDEVAAGELGRDLDRVAAAAGQEDLGVRHRRARGERLADLVRGPVADVARTCGRPRACASAPRPRRRSPSGRGRGWRTRARRCRRGSASPASSKTHGPSPRSMTNSSRATAPMSANGCQKRHGAST